MHVLEQTPAVLRSLVAGASAEDLDWQPSSERWSIAMVLAHLAEAELKGFVDRFRAIANEDDPLLPYYDQLALFRDGAKFDARKELDSFERLRGETLGWMRALPASVLARSGQHERFGKITFGVLLNEFAFHDLGHIRQVAELYRSHAFYPKMGGFQSYYKINP